MAVGIYLRVSTEEQRERQSIETQREFAQKYCDLHNLKIFRVYTDEGVAGTVPVASRPESSRLLEDARANRFDQLLVYKLDRLGRDARLILNAVEELSGCGVRVKSMTEEFDTTTAAGKLMLTLLSGFAAHEREVIRERSMAGTNRVAESGAWMGGIVPYGYRKQGEKRDARLVISDDPIPGLAMSEADVVRLIFDMSAVQRESCCVIAARLNDLNVPCAYVRDDRQLLRGKRRIRTSGIWRPGRIRGILTNKTYMGVHEFGKRSTKPREIISRTVPALVSADVWEKAQANLRSHFLFSKRSAKNQYLLRGLIKCGLCGLTYVGIAANRPNGKREFYYRCNGSHSPQIYSSTGRCKSKAVRGEELEQQIWSDVQAFIRDPKPVLDRLQAKLRAEADDHSGDRARLGQLETLVAEKETERSRVVALYRRGRLTDTELDDQMDEIAKEQVALEAQVQGLRGKLGGKFSVEKSLDSAETVLSNLRSRLEQPISWELKRRLVETLVSMIRVNTVEQDGVKRAEITAEYRFSQPDEPMPLTIPQWYGTSSVRVPSEPKTIGDHIRKRRLSLKLLQREVAERIGVDKTSIYNWEAGTSTPAVEYMPQVISFLGYSPLAAPTSLAEQLVHRRTTMGLQRAHAARILGIDPGTLARYERGEREPTGPLLQRVRMFLLDRVTAHAC